MSANYAIFLHRNWIQYCIPHEYLVGKVYQNESKISMLAWKNGESDLWFSILHLKQGWVHFTRFHWHATSRIFTVYLMAFAKEQGWKICSSGINLVPSPQKKRNGKCKWNLDLWTCYYNVCMYCTLKALIRVLRARSNFKGIDLELNAQRNGTNLGKRVSTPRLESSLEKKSFSRIRNKVLTLSSQECNRRSTWKCIQSFKTSNNEPRVKIHGWHFFQEKRE